MNKRLFIAIPIKAESLLLGQKDFLIANLSEEKINWVKDENLHLTLKFIGNTASKQVPVIINEVNDCIRKFNSFSIVLERIGIFGSSYNARVIWVGIRENNRLQMLQKNILQALEKIGYTVDRQNFVPHLTLGRINKINHKDHFKRVMENVEKGYIQESKVESFELFESILTPEGPIYKSIKSFVLAK